MQNKMESVNRYNEENGFPKLAMGIGVHTGEVILGNIGSDKKTKYDIIGNNVNFTSRLEGYTVGGQILISEQTKQKTAAAILGEKMEIFPKGISMPATVYEVKGYGEISILPI
jgi:adenylate cyclase